MTKPASSSERIESQFEEQARATAETQKLNSELSHQVIELQDQLPAERESTQERINLERTERETLEERLKEERAERERLLEEEGRSRLEFEKNMMAKVAQLSQQMGTQQTQTHHIRCLREGLANKIVIQSCKNILLQTASTTGTLGTRYNVIAPNTLIQATRMNSRMFRAMDPKI